MKVFKLIIFGLLGLIYFPLYLFVHFTHGKPEEGGWYPSLWEKKNPFARFLAIILWVPYFLATFFLDKTFKWFEELAE